MRWTPVHYEQTVRWRGAQQCAALPLGCTRGSQGTCRRRCLCSWWGGAGQTPGLQARDKTSFATGYLTHHPCVILRDLTMCYGIKGAWFQRLKVKWDEPPSILLSNSTCAATSWPSPRCRPSSSCPCTPSSGTAVQVDPINLTLKAPGTKRSQREYDEPLSNFAFKFIVRRYILVRPGGGATV